MVTSNDRGQAYTLEAVVAAVLIISSLLFALQVTAVTPLSASTSNQHIENQQRYSAAGTLAAADESGALKEAVLFWDVEEESFHEPDRIEYYTNQYPDNRFGNLLERSFSGHGLAVNVLVHFGDGDGDRETQRMVYRGEPSDNAASASRTVTLYESDWIRDAESHREVRLSEVEEGAYYVSKRDGGSVYNVVRVEVVVWRM